MYQRAAVAACAACRVAATPYVYASNSMERHFAALSPRRCNKRSGRRTRSSPAPGPGWCGRAAGPPRRGRSGVGQSQRLSDGHPSRVREPRVTTIGDRKDRRHGLRWVQRSVRGADGGTAPREPAMADAAYADSGPRGSAATGPVPTGPGMSRARARVRRSDRRTEPCITISITITASSMVRCTPLKARKLYVVASTSDAPRGFTRQRSQVHPLDGPPR